MKLKHASLSLAGLLAAALAMAPSVHAHATYNLSGYGPGVPGSVGTDGSPTAIPPATWTNGGAEGYAGKLPVMWYAGMHGTTQVRTIQTGSGANPPNDSLLRQVDSHNAASDPDLPADRVLAVGGKSWSDPDNGNQGWGHGLDYGLIHFSPIGEVLATGPVNFTITLTDDPADGVSPQLAFALYGGWDTSGTSVRHQTFTTSPTPLDDPLGSTGLTLLDFSVATGPGRTLGRTYALDTTYGGFYTVFVGALGGVAGQYQLSVTTAPVAQVDGDGDGVADPADNCPRAANADQLDADGDGLGDVCDTPDAECQSRLTQCTASLTTMGDDLTTTTVELAAATADADGDGHRDGDDACPDTPSGAPVDQAGCSHTQFCAAFDVQTKAGQRVCKGADWKNDEPLMRKRTVDCTFSRAARACQPRL